MLKSANKWVLEASTTPASVDSYGERYLGYIWYFDEKLNQYMNVNLQIVENGYSKNNCVNNPSYIYYSYFKDAEDFANVLFVLYVEDGQGGFVPAVDAEGNVLQVRYSDFDENYMALAPWSDARRRADRINEFKKN